MNILATSLSLAVTAFCVWLVVRIVNRRSKWAKRTVVALVAAILVGYPLSFGPACWLCERGRLDGDSVAHAYAAIIRAAADPETVQGIVIRSYASCFTDDDIFPFLYRCLSEF